MAFENISKGEFIKQGILVCVKEGNTKPRVMFEPCDKGISWDEHQENANFVSYCFNLQQRYDISKLEEAVKLIEDIDKNSITDYKKVKQLLKQIKK